MAVVLDDPRCQSSPREHGRAKGRRPSGVLCLDGLNHDGALLPYILYFHILKPEDRVAVKPYASPVFHAIQYLMGNQSREKLGNFRGFGGAQSYPSRTKDIDDVDFSTGSVGLGVAITAISIIYCRNP